MSDFRDEIKCPFEFNKIMIYKDYNECTVCGERVGQGIIPLSEHFCKCAGKGMYEAIMKIKDMPLETKDKMIVNKNENQ